ncbi:hypothetical protein QKU48_gp0388 [Fadolivirus algeromassiliense]|jgi:hypothetical protein|uniref:Uncharacterized protein n=1 Tax=Fadolivirus FV1/VV64 TaxID=3070911 RepID=A0A7D3QVJ7_9VIRU|nr:hypothetical protein QKU48_gp0388 [Fadolivirus algeromassiliense]QKF93846.1 hypothetical protein Fadolivirus_1_388 [Fadolivirus FV1/VV64]
MSHYEQFNLIEIDELRHQYLLNLELIYYDVTINLYSFGNIYGYIIVNKNHTKKQLFEELLSHFNYNLLSEIKRVQFNAKYDQSNSMINKKYTYNEIVKVLESN